MKEFIFSDLGRKFIYAVLLTALLFVMVLVGKLDSNSFLTAITGIYGFFVAGNVLDKFSPELSEPVTTPETTPSVTYSNDDVQG